jgi:hypothetical protein
MKKAIYVLLITIAFFIFLVACRSTLSRGEQNDETNLGKRVYFVYDSESPILMQPDINTVYNVFRNYYMEVDVVDLAGQPYDILENLLDPVSHTGMIVCLPYDIDADRILRNTYSADFNIIQFGGDYFPNDISVSIDYKYVGYLVGKRIGELFIEQGNASPRLGFYSVEREWEKIERGLIEGLSEIVPDAYIISRRIVAMSGETVMASGNDDASLLDGVCTFFCDSGSKNIECMDNIIQAKVSIKASPSLGNNVAISLIIEDNHISYNALTQYAQLLYGNITTHNEFIYDAVFEKS